MLRLDEPTEDKQAKRNLIESVQQLVSDVKNRIVPPTPATDEYSLIREELVAVRTQLVILNKMHDYGDPEYQESVAQQICAVKEKEHVLIKRAKRIRGLRVNIEGSLREHQESQLI